MQIDNLRLIDKDIVEISKLIYQSDIEILKYAFGSNKKKAPKRIEKLIRIGKNHYGYENIYVAYENDNILGFFICYTGKDQKDRKHNTDFLTFLKLMRAYGILKYKLFVRPLFMKISLVDVKNDDFYVDDLIAKTGQDKKDIYQKLLTKIFKIARARNCKRIIVDISKNNLEKKKFYEKNGFTVYEERIEYVKGEKIGNYFLEQKI